MRIKYSRFMIPLKNNTFFYLKRLSLPDGAKRKPYNIQRSNKLASSIALGMSALFFIIACANTNTTTTNKKKNTPLTKSAHLDKKISVKCTPQESPSSYELGDLVCIKSELTINANEKFNNHPLKVGGMICRMNPV